MPPEETSSTPPSISPEDLQDIFSGPSVFANKVFVTLLGPVARITFAEVIDTDIHFRVAATITINDLFSLRDVINGFEDKVMTIQAHQKADDV